MSALGIAEAVRTAVARDGDADLWQWFLLRRHYINDGRPTGKQPREWHAAALIGGGPSDDYNEAFRMRMCVRHLYGPECGVVFSGKKP